MISIQLNVTSFYSLKVLPLSNPITRFIDDWWIAVVVVEKTIIVIPIFKFDNRSTIKVRFLGSGKEGLCSRQVNKSVALNFGCIKHIPLLIVVELKVVLSHSVYLYTIII